jgi:ABC-type transport system involved in cytochrome c biogenesis permease subunit
MPLDRITLFCFEASYAVALILELLQLVRPRLVLRFLALGFGSAGLLAHTLYLAVQRPPLAEPFGTILFLAWILAVFYLYGTVHHRQNAWAVFVLPLVLLLVAVAGATPAGSVERPWLPDWDAMRGERFWGIVHGGLVLLAAVGGSVGCVASIMYLLQARQLRAKMVPEEGLRLLSLERLEEMNRRAINLAFPLLTAGLLVGIALMLQRDDPLSDWAAPKIVGTLAVWFAFGVLLYLRYGAHLPGRRLAFGTIIAFVLLLFTLAATHPLVQGAAP